MAVSVIAVRYEWLTDRLQASSDVHEDFRLWLSSKSTAVLPFALLQSSIKVSEARPYIHNRDQGLYWI